jgi:predicted nucleotide-binding protein
VDKAYEHDSKLLEQERDNLALELGILRERLISAYRRLVLIAGNENVSAKDRIDAEAASCEIALQLQNWRLKDRMF